MIPPIIQHCIGAMNHLVLAIPIIILYYNISIGLVMLSPSGITSVCNGDQIELTCNTTGSQVEWSVFGIPEGRTTAVRYGR